MAVTTASARPARPARPARQTHTEKGVSLARGPALILGTILLAAGLYLMYKQHRFLPFSNLPNGSAPVDGKVLFGIFGANGWTGMLTAVGGGLLLFGAAQHLLAKTMSLIVGVALGAAAVIAVASGNVLGMAAANSWTKIGWAIAAAILLVNTLVPRRRRVVEDPIVADRTVPEDTAYTRREEAEPARTDEVAPARAQERPLADEPVDERPTAVQEGPAASGDPLVRRVDPEEDAAGSETGTVSDRGTV